VALLGVALSAGCFSSPEQKYRVLSYILDDVPVPASMAAVEITPTTESETATRPAPRPEVYVKHEPYEERECESCHRSKTGNQLVAELNELCWLCHEEEDFVGEVTHGPVASGMCTGCHDPHKTPNEYMLVESGSGVCGQCHDHSTLDFSARHEEDETAECLDCHDPHSSDREYMLRPGLESDPAGGDLL
jgi:predicted CXXCH cytochrome family protein